MLYYNDCSLCVIEWDHLNVVRVVWLEFIKVNVEESLAPKKEKEVNWTGLFSNCYNLCNKVAYPVNQPEYSSDLMFTICSHTCHIRALSIFSGKINSKKTSEGFS